MAYESGALDATLAAAAGDDHALRDELHQVFRESVQRHVDLLRRSRCDGNWSVSANRIRGLAVSFHSAELADLADEALTAAPGEPVILQKLDKYVAKLFCKMP